MTYWSSARRISTGFGTLMFEDCRRASSFSSLSRMLLQTLMQLSQIYTPGPAISLRTSAWLLPQKEHIVRLEARAILVLEYERCYPDTLRGNATSATSTDRSPDGGTAPSSNFISFRDLITSSTRPYAFASSADI